jgi:hypothetical protein
MRQAALWAVVLGVVVAGGVAAPAQAPASAPDTQTAQITGGKLHGVVKSGATPLPGVTVTAQNTLTGKRYQTTTGITGAWTLTIPQNGRYVVRTQFAGFAQGSQEALLNAANHDQAVSFDLMLASRAAALAAQQDQGAESAQAMQAIRQLAGSGAQNLSLMSAMSGDAETQAGTAGPAGAALPSVAGNSDFGGESVAITGQTGQVSPMAGMDMDRIRDAVETVRSQLGGQGVEGLAGLFGGGGFGGPGGFGGGGGGFGGGGGGRGNFRGFNPGQPHGAVFWTGSNAALNAEPFSLRGQSQEQPASGTNRFGITFMSAPYIPGLTKPSGKDTVFLTLSGSRASNPLDEYATVPTDGSFGTVNERGGDFTGQAPIVDPANDTKCVNYGATPGQAFPGNRIPAGCIAPPANALLNGSGTLPKYFPAPNLGGYEQNYHLLTTAQTNQTQAGIRYMRALGKNATLTGAGRGGGRRTQTQGLRQSINFNYNWSHSAQDNVNLFPELGGKGSSDGDSVQAGYTLGYKKLTNIFNANWNRSKSQTTNFFTDTTDIATELGILGPGGMQLNASGLNYGLPNIQLSNIAGLSEQQPSFSLSQTIALSETLSWIHQKHNLRFGGDYRRVHRDFLGGSNSTGTFYFTGAYTGSSLADFLLGTAQETTIDAAVAKSYLRDNVMDMYGQDDWRVRPNLTLTFGLRYEFFAPYTEKYGHLAFIDTNATGGFTQAAEVEAGGVGPISGPLPKSLVHPYRTAFAPRFGLALRLPRQTVLRGGYGMNYTVGQYATFATTMAHQPPFANEQTNEAAAAGDFTLGNGFPAPAANGSYALDPHYELPYVQTWNVDVQKTWRWGIVMNAGYNGSKGSRLDITSAPGRTPQGVSYSGVLFNYEQDGAFSRFNAGTLRVNKRLSNGIALGANCQYSHSIDDAGSVGGTSTVVAQNWQDLKAEEGNSSFDVRHRVSGTYLYELPFGKDKFWLTGGTAAHIFEGFSISGNFTFATGTQLTPSYAAAAADVARGTAGSLRPDRVQGVSITAGGGSKNEWFNTKAFGPPAGPYGTASRNSITGPGTVQNGMSLSKTVQLGDTRSMEVRATANNVFNTVQYSGVDTNVASLTYGQVTSTSAMRSFNFMARFRF